MYMHVLIPIKVLYDEYNKRVNSDGKMPSQQLIQCSYQKCT
jgi:hypothetical protein